MDDIVAIVKATVQMTVGMGLFIGLTILAASVDGILGKENRAKREQQQQAEAEKK